MAGKLGIWIEAARPKTLAAAVVPVMVGTAAAVAAGKVDPVAAMTCLAFALLIQIGTNFANDYYDFVRGADTAERVGPRRAVAAGLVPASTMRGAMTGVFAAAFVVGLFLMYRFAGGWPGLMAGRGLGLLAIGIVSIVSGIAYTGGPFPLGYNGLGDLFVFVFFGLVAVNTTYFVQAGELASNPVAASIGVGLLAANILVANNYRDAETDARAGKRTLVVRFGRRFAGSQYAVSNGLAMACPMAMWMQGSHPWVLLPLLLAPWTWRLTRRLSASRDPREQIAILGATAATLAAYGVLQSAGLILAARAGR
ncbi:MAG TPA: 1,4-dihydroxy-2-naphthoate polyprenyltransferase [Candidatus Didemnitutus sp.]|nr:1,4-dihydroxy-2-naphthoate polyprenyltransferase [Candidatus Didemnitutus sp.]